MEGGLGGNQGALGFLNKPFSFPWDGPTEIGPELGNGFMLRGRVCGRTTPPCWATRVIIHLEGAGHWLRENEGTSLVLHPPGRPLPHPRLETLAAPGRAPLPPPRNS